MPSRPPQNSLPMQHMKKIVRLFIFLYIILLAIVLYSPSSSVAVRARVFVGLGDGDPAKDFADISYDGACNDWRNAQIVDIFFFSHLIGYAAMAYSVRSVLVAWVVSIGFEFIELSLKNWMPNFKECWWDSLILDVLLCNNFGIIFGSLLLRRYKADLPSLNAVANPAKALCICSSALLSITNGFSLKAVLWIPAPHPINPLRALLMAFQLYYFVLELTTAEQMLKWRNRKRGKSLVEEEEQIRQQGSMLVATLANLVEIPMIDLGCVTFLLEFAVVFKHGIYQGMFDIEKLPLPGVCYMASLFVLMVSTTAVVRAEIGGKGGSVMVSPKPKDY
mmetsp:Transcript_17240/g.34565  ORF Transcript_17240/g.34565 Transcript_17240/m.34565 type:complete len:334 (-) Transcript_17240:5-1006(-)